MQGRQSRPRTPTKYAKSEHESVGNERQGAWKLDVWFLDSDSYAAHANYSADLAARLTADERSVIRGIKEAYWRRPEYRDTITSDLIYRAVLDRGVKSAAEFERFLASDAA